MLDIMLCYKLLSYNYDCYSSKTVFLYMMNLFSKYILIMPVFGSLLSWWWWSYCWIEKYAVFSNISHGLHHISEIDSLTLSNIILDLLSHWQDGDFFKCQQSTTSVRHQWLYFLDVFVPHFWIKICLNLFHDINA